MIQDRPDASGGSVPSCTPLLLSRQPGYVVLLCPFSRGFKEALSPSPGCPEAGGWRAVWAGQEGGSRGGSGVYGVSPSHQGQTPRACGRGGQRPELPSQALGCLRAWTHQAVTWQAAQRASQHAHGLVPSWRFE